MPVSNLLAPRINGPCWGIACGAVRSMCAGGWLGVASASPASCVARATRRLRRHGDALRCLSTLQVHGLVACSCGTWATGDAYLRRSVSAPGPRGVLNVRTRMLHVLGQLPCASCASPVCGEGQRRCQRVYYGLCTAELDADFTWPQWRSHVYVSQI